MAAVFQQEPARRFPRSAARFAVVEFTATSSANTAGVATASSSSASVAAAAAAAVTLGVLAVR